jgi:imidazolonepropionase-like amidohydrolase
VDSIEHMPWDALADEDVQRLVDADIPIVPTLYVFLTDPREWLSVEGERYYCSESLGQAQELLELYREGRVTPEMTQQGYYLDWDLILRALPVIRENAAKLVGARPTIGFGTDSGGSQFAVFGRIHEELDNLLQAGFSPLEVLRSATVVNARILRLEDKLGSLEPGKLADLIVVDGDPLVDISTLRQVWMVVKEGRVVHKEGM